MERVYKYYTEDLKIRAVVANTTELIRTMKEVQGTFPLATLGLGRLLTGTLLMASQLSENQSISTRILGNGILGELMAEANFEGGVRAYCPNRDVDLRKPDGHLDLSKAVGQGVLTVARTLPFQKEPHVGIVPIQTGEVAEDLAFYLLQSHQVPSILALSVSLDSNGEVRSAGGVLVEVMPGANESLISELEKKALTAPPLSEQLQNAKKPIDLLKAYVHDSKIIFAEEGPLLNYSCRCSNERIERTLLLLGRATLAEMALKGEPLQMRCEFCGRGYTVPIQRVKELHDTLSLPN